MAAEFQHPQKEPGNGAKELVMHFVGDKVFLDEANCQRLYEKLVALSDSQSQDPVVLDMGNVKFISSTGIGLLLKLHRQMLRIGRRLTLRNLSPEIYETFAVCKLETLLGLKPTDTTASMSSGGYQVSSGVLVVDDTLNVRSLLEVILWREGFTVFSAGHGLQAVEEFKQHQHEIVVVLLDVQMPDVDGPTTLAALQRIDSNIRCCFMTSHPHPYTEEQLLRQGASRVFRKPLALTQLVGALRQLARQPSPNRFLNGSRCPREEHEAGWS
jgi:anti-anti-sigma factor